MPEAPQPPQENKKPESVSELLGMARTAGAEKTKAKQEEKAARRSVVKETIKSAWSKTRETARNTTDTIKGLASKDVRGEIKGLVVDKISNAKDKLVDKYDSIIDKADIRKEAAAINTREKATQLSNKTKDILVVKPAEEMKMLGTDVAHYFANKGKNIVDRIKAEQADADANFYKRKANIFDRKSSRGERKLEHISDKLRAAREAGREHKSDRLQRKEDKLDAKVKGAIFAHQQYKESARLSREKASELRTNVANRK